MERVDHFALVYVTLLMWNLIISAVCGEGYDFFIPNILLWQHKSIFKNLLTRCSVHSRTVVRACKVLITRTSIYQASTSPSSDLNIWYILFYSTLKPWKLDTILLNLQIFSTWFSHTVDMIQTLALDTKNYTSLLKYAAWINNMKNQLPKCQ